MHVQEKQAWFVLGVSAVVGAMAAVLVAVFGPHPGVYFVFGLFFLLFFTPLIGRRQRRAGEVVFDERDRQIAASATLGGYSIFWGLLVAAAMGPWLLLGPTATLSVRTTTITNLLAAAILVIALVRSLIVVVLYRRGAHG